MCKIIKKFNAWLDEPLFLGRERAFWIGVVLFLGTLVNVWIIIHFKL